MSTLDHLSYQIEPRINSHEKDIKANSEQIYLFLQKVKHDE